MTSMNFTIFVEPENTVSVKPIDDYVLLKFGDATIAHFGILSIYFRSKDHYRDFVRQLSADVEGDIS